MVGRFKQPALCLLIIAVQFVISPGFDVVSAEMKPGYPDAAALTPPQSVITSPAPDPSQKAVGYRPVNGDFHLPERRNLPGLTGTSEITVQVDFDGLFTKSINEYKVVGNDLAGRVEDTTLPESSRTGRTISRESLAALTRTEQAKAQTGQAFALLLPSVSVRFNTGYEISDPSVAIDENGDPVTNDSHPRTDVALTVRQTLFDLPSYRDWRRRQVIEQARGDSYRVSDADAYLTTANAYLSLVSTRLQIDMTREFEDQLSSLLQYIEKRVSAGAATISDMARVRARRDSAVSSRLELESAHAAAGIEFVRLTNLAPQKLRLPVPDDVGASLLPKTFTGAVTTAMQSNPELAALTAEMQAADIDVAAATGRYMPRVDAEFTDAYSRHAGGDSGSQRDQRIMMVLNWSIYNGGGDYQTRLERIQRYKELQYRLDDQRRRVIQALSSNYATLATTTERIGYGYDELKSISTATEAMSKRMISGNQSLLDLLDVYERAYMARTRLVNLHVLEMTTVSQLVRLTFGAPEYGAPGKGSSDQSGGNTPGAVPLKEVVLPHPGAAKTVTR